MRLDKKLKKKLILNAPYVLFVYLFDKVAQGIRLAPGADASQKLLHLADGFGSAFASPLPSFHPIDLLIGIAGAVIMWVVVYVRGKNAKKFRKNTEYGSARWGTPEDIEPYMDPDFRNNIILTQTERLTMNSRPKDPKTARKKNVLVIGGSGSGKTRFFVKPQLMQLHSSYVVTDPKGSLLVECGRLMDRAGYKIKVFNTINFKKSMHYNPFAYIHSEKDILKLVNTLITNTKGEGKGGDDFWLKAETLLYTALIGYIYYEAPKEEQNFATLVEFINAMEVREDDETFENNVDIAFRELGERDPNHFAVRQWRKYKLAAGVISLKRLLNHHFLRNWSSKMIKKSLEAYFLPKIQNCTFLKTFSKDGNILPRQSGYSVRSFSNRHKNPEKFKKVTLLPCKTASERWVK